MMPRFNVALIVLVLCLGHYSFTQFWYGGRGGFRWFWSYHPASALTWAARLSFVIALLASAALIAFDQAAVVAIPPRLVSAFHPFLPLGG